MPSEPEAVPADYQALLTRRAAQNAAERDATELRASQQRIRDELDYLASLQLSPRFRSHVRAMRRQLAQLIGSSETPRL